MIIVVGLIGLIGILGPFMHQRATKNDTVKESGIKRHWLQR
jgi:ABC-type Fe3+-siderophore transport system permease subunit